MIKKTLEELGKKENSNFNLLKCFKEISISKNNFKEFIFIIIFSTIISISIGCVNNTVEIFESISLKILEFEIALFGIIFTAFSIILTFLNSSLIKKLATIKSKENENLSTLIINIDYYKNILYLYFIAIILSLAVYIAMQLPDNNTLIISNILLSNTVASILMFIYFLFTFRIIWEIKSVINNTIQMFRIDIAYKLLDKLINSDEKAED